MIALDYSQFLSFEHQHQWGVGIAIYLFLGGLGASMGLIAALYKHAFKKDDPSTFVWSTLLGVLFVNIGSIFLVLDMFVWDSFIHGKILEIFKVFLAFFGAAVFHGNFHPWIQWGANFIIWYSLIATLWALSMADKAVILNRFQLIRKLAQVLQPIQNYLGWLTVLLGFGVGSYTGLLLSVAPSIPAWNHPFLPVLFGISAISTATAWYMLWTYFAKNNSKESLVEFRKQMNLEMEWIDIALITAEILALIAYFNYLFYGYAGGKYVFHNMLSDFGFVIGFLLFGLIVPWLLELYAAKKHVKILVPIAAVLVLFGGFLLRYYILHYGIYTYPWPS